MGSQQPSRDELVPQQPLLPPLMRRAASPYFSFTISFSSILLPHFATCILLRSELYTLTSIFQMAYIKSVDSVFEIIAEPNRRAILSLLVSSQQSVGEIERQLRMPQPTVSKHLRVLREAGF